MATSGVWVAYTVPVGYRAVVKSIAGVQGASAAGNIICSLNGVNIYVYPAPGQIGASYVATSQVAYANEVIRGYTANSNMSLVVSGYLLHDDGTGPRWQDQTSIEIAEKPQQLPDKELDVLPTRGGARIDRPEPGLRGRRDLDRALEKIQ